MPDRITKTQNAFFYKNWKRLADEYLAYSPLHIDPDSIRDSFVEIGYNRTNVQRFQGICKLLTEVIYFEALERNTKEIRKVIFAAGLPATGKTSHLRKMAQGELVYDGTINDDGKFIKFVQAALDAGYRVEIFIYSADPKRAFLSNLQRGDQIGRYVPISHYEKVAQTINRRADVIKSHFRKSIKIRNFSYTNFEGRPKKFSPLIVDRHELENIARRHRFKNSDQLAKVIA